MSTPPETRQDIAQRALDRAKAKGVALEDDRDFMILLNEWIQGEIPMRVMRDRYFSAVAERAREQRVRRQAALPMAVPAENTTSPLRPDEKRRADG